MSSSLLSSQTLPLGSCFPSVPPSQNTATPLVWRRTGGGFPSSTTRAFCAARMASLSSTLSLSPELTVMSAARTCEEMRSISLKLPCTTLTPKALTASKCEGFLTSAVIWRSGKALTRSAHTAPPM